MKFPNLENEKIIALDIETYDPDLKELGPGPRRNGKILGVAIATKDKSWYFEDSESDLYTWLHSIEHKTFIGANFMYDMDFLQYKGFNPKTVLDVQIAEPLIDENQGHYSLDFLGNKYLGLGKMKDEIQEFCDLNGLKGDPRKHLYKMPPALVGKYAKIDAELTLKVFEKQLPILEEQDLVSVFDMEMRLFPLLMKMRRQGVRINRKGLYDLDEKYSEIIEDTQKKLDSFCGFKVNINSRIDMAKAFNKFGYHYNYNERTEKMIEADKDPNPCFNAAFLASCDHELARYASTIRTYRSIKSKFLDGLDKFIINGRLHCMFWPMKREEFGTVSGRFSSAKPNLQQIPSNDFKKDIRSLFLPEEGHLWGRGDESQIELRMLAHYAIGEGSDEIRNRFIKNPGTDYHQECADMTGMDRKPAKTINFGVVYGMGVAKLCASLGLSENEGREVLNNYHDKLPFLKQTTREIQRVAESRGYIRTILKRRRRFPDKNLCYKAANSLFQGSAAEVMKKIMVDAYDKKIFDVLIPHLTIHDELDYSIPPTKEGEEAEKELKYIAENCIKFRVPLKFDLERGPNWGNLSENI